MNRTDPLSDPEVAAEGRAFDSIKNYVTRLGVVGEDPAMAARPTMDGRLSPPELDALYAKNDLARRIVDEIVEDALRGGFEIRDFDSNEMLFEVRPETDDSNKEVSEDNDADEGPDILAALDRACKDARLYGGAHILLIADDTSALDQPLDFSDPAEILNLILLDRWEATPVTYESDPRNRRFTKPNTYSVTPATNGAPALSLAETHHSRMLRFDGAELPRRLRLWNDDYHDSVLQPVWDALRNFTSTEQAIGTIVQRFETASIKIAGLSEALSVPDGDDLVQKRMDIAHKSLALLNAMLLDADGGEEYTRSFATVTGLDTIWDRLAHSVAKAARMPMTQLFGLSPSGLSTDDEAGKANWRKQVASYQAKQLRPALERYFRLLNDGNRVKVIFPPLDESTALEEAEIKKLHAEADHIRIEDGIIDRLEVRQDLIERGDIVDRSGMEPEDPVEKQIRFAEAQNGLQNGEDPDETGNEDPEEDEDPDETGNEAPETDEEDDDEPT